MYMLCRFHVLYNNIKHYVLHSIHNILCNTKEKWRWKELVKTGIMWKRKEPFSFNKVEDMFTVYGEISQ